MKSKTTILNHQPSQPKSNKHNKFHKKIVWEKTIKKVNEITDSLGKGIDKKIKETVAIFLIYKFTTSGSCEGHLTKNKKQIGLPYPWVEIYAPEPKRWQTTKGKSKEQLGQRWLIKNLKQQQRMIKILKKFYQKRKTPFDARLIFDKIGAFGGFRIQSFGANTVTILKSTEQKQKLVLYQKEMKDFTIFLINKYFSKE